MIPISYSTMGPGHYLFNYAEEDYREWTQRGESHGDVGPILWRIRENFLTYLSFGTIEHPRKTMFELTIVHNPHFDGPMKTPEEYCTPKAREWEFKLITLNAHESNIDTNTRMAADLYSRRNPGEEEQGSGSGTTDVG